MEEKNKNPLRGIKSGDWVKIESDGIVIIGKIVIFSKCSFYGDHKIVTIHGFNLWFAVDFAKITKLTKEQIDILGLDL